MCLDGHRCNGCRIETDDQKIGLTARKRERCWRQENRLPVARLDVDVAVADGQGSGGGAPAIRIDVTRGAEGPETRSQRNESMRDGEVAHGILERRVAPGRERNVAR